MSNGRISPNTMVASAGTRWHGSLIRRSAARTLVAEHRLVPRPVNIRRNYMILDMNNDIEAWEGEGGATQASSGHRATSSNSALSQAEWTQRIKQEVTAKFNQAGSVISIDCKKTKRQTGAQSVSTAADDSIKPLGMEQ